MVITSKYAGKCAKCDTPYEAGEQIWWESGEPTLCIDCHENLQVNAASPVQPVQKGVTVRYNPPSSVPETTEELKRRIKALLANVGNVGTCRGCNAPIYWVTHNNGKKTPYTETGLNHFADCPKAKEFKAK